jgi:hypothetical protein
VATIQHSIDKRNIELALVICSKRAKDAFEDERARIERGLELCLTDKVQLFVDGTATVASQVRENVVYTVHHYCQCFDAQRAPGGRCKHRWARSLLRKAIREVKSEAYNTWYAQYEAPNGAFTMGTARITPKGWLFMPEEGEPLYASQAAIILLGNVALVKEDYDHRRTSEGGAQGARDDHDANGAGAGSHVADDRAVGSGTGLFEEAD